MKVPDMYEPVLSEAEWEVALQQWKDDLLTPLNRRIMNTLLYCGLQMRTQEKAVQNYGQRQLESFPSNRARQSFVRKEALNEIRMVEGTIEPDPDKDAARAGNGIMEI